jgi:two-component system, chemotaxis family, chemotaxis protein CheY
MLDQRHASVTVSLDVVWQDSAGKQDARMSEISMQGCYIDTKVQGRNLGETIGFKVHLPGGPWVSLQGELINQEYPIGFGLRFVNLKENERKLLAQVVAAHGSAPPEAPDSNILALDTDAEIPKAPERPRVLVADDDELTLRMVTAIVETEGYEVVPAHDGRQALGILQREAGFSAAIFDMTMPHLKGLDLILFMKADEQLRHIPVGMITAEQDPKVWDDSVAAGASVFLPKPFSPPQVKMLLRMLVRPSGI